MTTKLISLLFIIVLVSACNEVVPAESPSPTETPVPDVATATNVLPPPSGFPYAPVLNEALPKDGLLLAAHVYADNTCYDIGIYDEDTYIVISCHADFTYPTPNGKLDTNQSAYLHRWLERFASYEDPSAHGLLKFVGKGDVVPDYADKQSMSAMLFGIEWDAHGYVHRGGTPSAVLISLRVLSNQLGIPLDQTNVLHFEVVDFPDPCFGAPEAGEVCGQVVTQGFRVQLVAQGLLYEFHTDVFGYDIRQIGEPQIAPTQGAGG